ncbi:autophagy protein, partial [Termitomyces sp. T159_Od127]
MWSLGRSGGADAAAAASRWGRDEDDGARGIVEMLFCTSLIALVGAADQPQSSPRKLQIVNTK